MNSSFQKSPDLSEENHPSGASFYCSQKKPNRSWTSWQGPLAKFWEMKNFDADEEEGEYDYDEKTDMPIGQTGLKPVAEKSRKKITARKF